MARKVKPSHEPASPAVQEYIKRQQAEAAAKSGTAPAPSDPAPAPPSNPSAPPPPLDPIAASRAPVQPRPPSHVSGKPAVEGWLSGKTGLLIGVFVGLGVLAFGVFWVLGRSATSTPDVGRTEISQLRQGMTCDEVQAVLGKPQSARKGPGTRRENGVERIEQAGFFEYYRKGTLMLVYDKSDTKLIEVCIGETTDEYAQRKEKKGKVLWESYPETGFIHQDVWRPNQTM